MVLNANCSIEDIITLGDEIVTPIIYCSPEVLRTPKLRNMISSSSFRENCIGVAIDETNFMV